MHSGYPGAVGNVWSQAPPSLTLPSLPALCSRSIPFWSLFRLILPWDIDQTPLSWAHVYSPWEGRIKRTQEKLFGRMKWYFLLSCVPLAVIAFYFIHRAICQFFTLFISLNVNASAISFNSLDFCTHLSWKQKKRDESAVNCVTRSYVYCLSWCSWQFGVAFLSFRFMLLLKAEFVSSLRHLNATLWNFKENVFRYPWCHRKFNKKFVSIGCCSENRWVRAEIIKD